MNGIDFLGELRSSHGGDKPKVVFCTTERDQESIRSIYDTGADEHLVKPFDQETLEIKLQQLGMV